MKLTPIMQKYILHWGEMGARWGVNRTVAQIHALLYLSPEPLHAEEIAVSATCVRVPVFIGHSEAVHIELTNKMSPEEAREILQKAPGVKIVDDLDVNMYPLATRAAGRDDTLVGRIRTDASHPNGLAMWIVSDNLRKGAALNAVQIAETIIANKLHIGWSKK